MNTQAKILIIRATEDPHADAVCWGLRQLGCEAVVWDWSNFPKADMGFLALAGDTSPAFGISIDGVLHTAPFDVIWVRRKASPTPMVPCHPDDVDVIGREAQAFIDNMLPFLGDAHTRWVNEIHGDQQCTVKMHQLHVASQLGFTIPDTLVGNDLQRVAAFFAEHHNRVVHKSLRSAHWDNEDGSRTVARTSRITAAHLASEYAVRACPGIYQPLIAKQYELRVTVMGESVIAAAIDSQRDGETVDWRMEGGRGVTNIRAIDIGPELAAMCLALCRRLHLNFGCIDLIVGVDDVVTFLEVNNIGQFLWKELGDASIPTLDTFCRYLLDASYTVTTDTIPRLHMADFLAQVRAASAQADAIPA